MGVLLNMFGQGMVLSYPSVILPALLSPNSIIKTEFHEASLVASCIGFAGIPGFLSSSFLMEMYGRKKAHVAVLIPGIVGWLIIYFATSISVLLCGRCLCGFAVGATISLGAIVIGEYTSPKNRGIFLNLKTAAVCLGNMAVHILAHFLNWNTIALIAVIPLMLALVIILTWPESPSWLASKRRFDESQMSFYWLRGNGKRAILEMEDLLRTQKEKLSQYPEHVDNSNMIMDFIGKFKDRSFVKPLIIVCFAGLLLESCGRHIFPAFAMQIIGEITSDKSQSFYYTLGMDTIITASALFSSYLVKIMKRRTLLLGSGFIALFVLFCVCFYMLLSAKGIVSNERTWIPILLFTVYFIVSNLGCTPIPLALLGEIFPLAHRGAGSCVSGFILCIYLMMAMQASSYLLVTVQVYGTFAVFGLLMGISLIALYVILPETKDRTLQQIEHYFQTGKFRHDNLGIDEVNMKMLSS
ncbi:facilitated trehalose transporter Tret1-like [Danaus plexippus]|uniref:facilitated trehalose transporter Tret1-like n=1 Tax=Danaus plexippus TaxID=13037 RepID=UPI002AB21E98|nr:facilitated trehalose transporter Tret1-like [Danaus plexippus]